jgi:hypothetical protein
MSASKTLGIIGICTGWLLPIVGVVLGIIGLCLKKDKEVALNVISIVIAIVAWIFWIGIFIG